MKASLENVLGKYLNQEISIDQAVDEIFADIKDKKSADYADKTSLSDKLTNDIMLILKKNIPYTISLDTTIASLDISSLEITGIMNMISSRYNITIPATFLFEVKNFRDFIGRVLELYSKEIEKYYSGEIIMSTPESQIKKKEYTKNKITSRQGDNFEKLWNEAKEIVVEKEGKKKDSSNVIQPRYAHLIKTNNSNVISLDVISEDGPPVLFIGGLGCDYSIWQKQFPILIEDYKIMVYYPPGHADTYLADVSFTNISKQLNQICQALNLDKFSIIGWSQGGVIAQHFSFTYPNKVDKLILLATYCKPYMEKISQFDDLSNNHKRIVKQAMKYNDISILQIENQSGSSYDFTNRLKDIKAETLLIVGEDDHVHPVKCMQKIQKNINNAKLEIVADATHYLMVDKSDAVNLLIKESLQAK